MSPGEAILQQLRQHGEGIAAAMAARISREAVAIATDIGREIDNRLKEVIDEINGDLSEREEEERQ